MEWGEGQKEMQQATKKIKGMAPEEILSMIAATQYDPSYDKQIRKKGQDPDKLRKKIRQMDKIMRGTVAKTHTYDRNDDKYFDPTFDDPKDFPNSVTFYIGEKMVTVNNYGCGVPGCQGCRNYTKETTQDCIQMTEFGDRITIEWCTEKSWVKIDEFNYTHYVYKDDPEFEVERERQMTFEECLPYICTHIGIVVDTFGIEKIKKTILG